GAIDEHIERLAGGAVQLDDGALVELQQVSDRDARAADFHGECDRHIQDDFEVDIAAGLRRLILQVVEFRGARLGYVGVHRKVPQVRLAMAIEVAGAGRAERRIRSSTFTACSPRERPKLPRKTGTSSASRVTLPEKSQGRTSPGFIFNRGASVIEVRPSRVLICTSASSRSSRRLEAQRSSFSARSLATPASRISRSGSSIEYGIVTLRLPPPPSSSIWKLVIT